MVQQYTVFGRQVGSHVLAMATLAVFAIPPVYISMRPKKAAQTPPINASSPDEADFIQKYIEKAELDDKKAKH